MQIIEISNLIYILIPALLVLIIQYRWSMDARSSAVSIARMILQLVLIGYLLTYIFAAEQAWIVLLVLSVMLCAAAWIGLRPVESKRALLFVDALLAIFLVNAVLLAIITAGVLHTDPWFAPAVVIPLAGMVFASGMNAISLFSERYYAELERADASLDRHPSTLPQSIVEKARNSAYEATMIPTVNSLMAVGLVALPGMMTGQILSGVSPLIAVRYQIMIMLMLLASTGLSTALFYLLIRRRRP